MPETINIEDTQYNLNLVKVIFTQVGTGLSGSAQERENPASLKGK